ncbi:MAG: hypothetical protein IKW04_01470 [Clostridia bacterium]|nr:hypothetical protein [Clostridia bacterium]
MKKLLAMLLAAMMVFTVVGCEQKPATTETKAPADGEVPVATEAPAEIEEASADITGTYVLTSSSDNGEEIPAEMLPQLSCTLNEDYTGTYANGGGEIQIQWAQEGNTVTFTAVGDGPADPLVLTAEGNTLTGTDGTTVLVFTKQ